MSYKGSWNRVADHKSYGQTYDAIFGKKDSPKTPHEVSASHPRRRQGKPKLLSEPGGGVKEAEGEVSRKEG